eukprot:800388-Pleurochrysis_carterae.AAC.1
MLNFRGRAIDAKLPRSLPSCSFELISRAHGGTVIQRAFRLCPYGVVVCSGRSWPSCRYIKISFPYTKLTLLRTTVVVAP